MSNARLERVDAGRYRISGDLMFGTVNELLASARKQFQSDTPREIDLSGVTASDSAGLALLIEWFSAIGRNGSTLRFIGAPAQLSALAKISDVDRVLSLNDLP